MKKKIISALFVLPLCMAIYASETNMEPTSESRTEEEQEERAQNYPQNTPSEVYDSIVDEQKVDAQMPNEQAFMIKISKNKEAEKDKEESANLTYTYYYTNREDGGEIKSFENTANSSGNIKLDFFSEFPNIETVVFEKINLTKDFINELEASGLRTSATKNIVFTGCSINKTDAEEVDAKLKEILSTKTKAEIMKIDFSNGESFPIKTLEMIAKEYDSLSCLGVNVDRLSNEIATSISQAMEKNKEHLKHIYLSVKSADNGAMSQMLSSMKNLQKLTGIHLFTADINPEVIVQSLKDITIIDHIKVLELRADMKNAVDKKYQLVESLSEFIGKLDKLEHLDLSGIQVEGHGSSKLFKDALDNKGHLYTLNLDNIQITEDNIEFLIANLNNMGQLKQLHLSSCSISDAVLGNIVTSLEKLQNITAVYLDNNKIETADFTNLASKPEIILLSISNNKLDNTKAIEWVKKVLCIAREKKLLINLNNNNIMKNDPEFHNELYKSALLQAKEETAAIFAN